MKETMFEKDVFIWKKNIEKGRDSRVYLETVTKGGLTILTLICSTPICMHIAENFGEVSNESSLVSKKWSSCI